MKYYMLRSMTDNEPIKLMGFPYNDDADTIQNWIGKLGREYIERENDGKAEGYCDAYHYILCQLETKTTFYGYEPDTDVNIDADLFY